LRIDADAAFAANLRAFGDDMRVEDEGTRRALHRRLDVRGSLQVNRRSSPVCGTRQIGRAAKDKIERGLIERTIDDAVHRERALAGLQVHVGEADVRPGEGHTPLHGRHLDAALSNPHQNVLRDLERPSRAFSELVIEVGLESGRQDLHVALQVAVREIETINL
jgi:hypothetical protein